MPRHCHTLLLVCALSLLSGCGLGLYELPDPPRQDKWTSISLDPAAEERAAQERALAARQAALRFYEALSEENWDKAWEMLSSETQSFLAFGSSTGEGKDVLEKGLLTQPDGSSVEITPIALFLVEDMRQLKDEFEGRKEAETTHRKELYAISAEGDVNKIVLIYETGQWRVHRTQVGLSE